MRKIASLALSLFLVSAPAFADTPKDADAQPAKPAQPAKAKPAKKADKSDSAIAAQLEELRQAVQAQQEQLSLLKEELAKRDRQIDEAREAAAAANAKAAEASTKATEAVNASAEVKTEAATLNTAVADVKSSNDVLKATVANNAEQEKKASEDGPATIHIRGINIKPGGFIAAETVFRNHATGDGINTQFTGIPYPNLGISRVTENAFEARQSRLTLLADTVIGSAKVQGYFEGDFLGTGVTSNNRQSNSYVFRQRQLWGRVSFENGFAFSAGQMWSLVTEGSKGIENLQEKFPMQIDPQYIVGWAWQRAYGARVVKDFGKFAVAAAIEGPQTTFTSQGQNNNFFFNTAGAGGGLENFVDATGYTANKSPDFLVKATLDPGRGHFEVVGIISPFRDHVYPCGQVVTTVADLPTSCGTPQSPLSTAGEFSDGRVGGGVGVTGRMPFAQKKVEVMAHFQGGDGIGRYSSAQLSDVTARPDGTLAPIRTAAYLAELELHPSPKFDFYAYYGGEVAARTNFTFFNTTTGLPQIAVGYGSPLFNNSGCVNDAVPTGAGTITPSPTTPGVGGGCRGDVHQVIEGTLGFWHNVYSGSKGRVRWGIQYSYIEKVGFSGNNFNFTTQTAGPSQRPTANDNMILTSFRYYLP